MGSPNSSQINEATVIVIFARRKLIAAVIPVRNRPELLKTAVESVFRQTHPVAEIIIVDDCSTDHTVAVALELASQDHRVTVLCQPVRSGANAARNRGWKASSSEFIAFLDSDDVWVETKIERQVADILSSGCKICFTGNKKSQGDPGYRPTGSFSLLDLQKRNVLPTTSTVMVHREALEAVGGFDESLPSCQDWDLWIKLRSRGEFVVISEPLVIFNDHSGDRISKNYAAVVDGHEAIFTRIYSTIENRVDLRKVKSYHEARLAQIMHNDFGLRRKALIHLIKALLNYPTKYALGIALQVIRAP